MVVWGYRANEVELPAVWPEPQISNDFGKDCIVIHPSVEIKRYRDIDPNSRRPVAGSLGIHVDKVCCPHPDQMDTNTTLEGALYRFCPKIPHYEEHKPAFRKFVSDWCLANLKPLSPDTDTTVESWLAGTNYTLARKKELLEKFSKVQDPFDPKYHVVKSFVKDEFYPEYKHARAINSRADEFKCLTGPIFQKIAEELFSRPEFIKKVPVHLRPQAMLDRVFQENGKYMLTDFSSFEAHFKDVIMQDCEFVMYEYMTQYLADHDQFMRLVTEVIGGTNHLEFKNLILEILATRMSGEMNTSTGNGFSNLMFILYICSITPGCENVKPIVEGDDSATSTNGVLPTQQQFADFGLRIKLAETDDICKASFCGMVFDKEEKNIITDPREVLATFGWTTNRYIRSRASVKKTLLRCKALSLAYQYPSCPILSAFAKRVLYLTRSHEVKNFVEKQGRFLYNQYDIELFKEAELRNRQGTLLFSEPGPNTRKLVEELYSIPIGVQKQLENYFDNLQEIAPLNHPALINLMPDLWIEYFEKYSATISPTSINYEYPTQLWPAVRERYADNMESLDFFYSQKQKWNEKEFRIHSTKCRVLGRNHALEKWRAKRG